MTLPTRITDLPCWRGTPTGTPLPGGLSNEIWKVTDAAGDNVVRFGTDYPFHHVERTRELMTTRAAHAAGFGPAVTYAGPGVMVTAYLNARTWTGADLCANPARVGRLLHDFHHQMPAHISGTAHLFWVFHVIRDYARSLKAGNSPFTPRLPDFLNMAEGYESVQIALPIIFGHNDLLPANILDDGQRLWLIDYEYAGFSTALFDLAGAASNAGMSADQSTALLSAYFGTPPDKSLQRAFDAMQCASLLREAMWAMISALHLNAPGVDYTAYAQDNLTRLHAAHDAFLTRYGHIPS